MSLRDRGPRLEELSRSIGERNAAQELADRERLARKQTAETAPTETAEQKKRRHVEWNRREGAMEYAALTAEATDPDSMQQLADAEEDELDLARGVFPKVGPMAQHYERLVASNRREIGPMDADVEKRLQSVAAGVKKQYGSTEQWADTFLGMMENNAVALPEDEIASRVKGFAFAALKENDFATAYTTLDRAGLLDDTEVRAMIDERLAALERSDSPADEAALKRLINVFGVPQEKAA